MVKNKATEIDQVTKAEYEHNLDEKLIVSWNVRRKILVERFPMMSYDKRKTELYSKIYAFIKTQICYISAKYSNFVNELNSVANLMEVVFWGM